VIPNFQFELCLARMHWPTNFIVSGEIDNVSTGGSIDAVQQIGIFSGSIRLIEAKGLIEPRA
jgi:hypothetical protein